MNRISVIIPTIGRETLSFAIDSILSQGDVIHEVIVVGSKSGLNFEFKSPKVRYVQASTFGNISIARNTGLAHVCATSNFIGFCDDDDMWLENKADLQLKAMNRNGWNACLTSAYLVREDGKKSIRPSIPYLGETSPLKYIYGFKNRREKYFPLPSLLFSVGKISTLRFDENLKEREDLQFLEDIYNLDLKIGQLSQPLVRIASDPNRSIQRVSLKNDIAWVLTLSKTSIAASLNFMFFVSIRNQVFKFFMILKNHFFRFPVVKT